MLSKTEVPETWHSHVEINLSDLRDNIRYLRGKISPETRQMAVVKADAYGHGIVDVSKAVEEEVSWLGVANVPAAVELREKGIKLPILVFGVPTKHTAPVYESANLTAAISDITHFDILPPGVNAHLHFDTGMNRLGIKPDMVDEVQRLSNRSKINITGIMSHFACADEPKSSKTTQQLDVMKSVMRQFPQEWDRHIHNSGGILYHYDPEFTMVRHGISMYGYDPAPEPVHPLKPVLTWKSRIVQVKPIKKGETISYGARWEAESDGHVLVVPVGYADGLPRNMTGQIAYYTNGQWIPVTGIVTMDYTMLFSKKTAKPGDEVIVLGGRSHNLRELADATGTITYELLTRIAPKVPRHYIE